MCSKGEDGVEVSVCDLCAESKACKKGARYKDSINRTDFVFSIQGSASHTVGEDQSAYSLKDSDPEVFVFDVAHKILSIILW